ncbi:HAD-like protein [Xylariaceae sp. AK1471]|nr:HAD-like protein [Xylariaceae sp. AK1471]
MDPTFKALVFDLGGVLLEWDRHSVNTLSSGQFLTIMNSTTWYSLDRGLISLKKACNDFGILLGVYPAIVETSLEQAQMSLTVNFPLVQTIHDLRASNPDLKFYVMSNISREHYEIVRGLDLPWSVFTFVYASGVEGMRKPDLCSFQYIINKTGCLPNEVVMIDDTAENICAARSLGMHGILVDNISAKNGGALRNLLQQPLPRAEAFLKANAGNHHCTVEGHNEIVLKDNFAQLMIWELTGNADIIYLKWPSGKLNGMENSTNGEPNGKTINHLDVKNGLCNYFYEEPVLTTSNFPPDADTTSTAYLSLPASYLSEVADVKVVLNAMAENIDTDGIMQTYFSKERPRTCPEVCCNILRVFHRFGYGSDPRIKDTERWVVDCLKNKACLDGNRHYSTPEGFLYLVARLYVECSSLLRTELEAVKDELLERINVLANPLALALRLAACQFVGIDRPLYRKDLEMFMSLQNEDGGWPAGHFCCMGRTGARIGNRGLTTALAMKIIQYEKAAA